MLFRKITPTNMYTNLVQNDLFQGDESLFLDFVDWTVESISTVINDSILH